MSAGKTGEWNAREGLLLALGCLGALPDLLLGSLSSSFIDQVLTAGDTGRAPPILGSYLALSALALWLDRGYLRLLEEAGDASGGRGGAAAARWVRGFTILLNTALAALLHPLALLPCWAVLWLALPWLRRGGRGLSVEGAGALQAVLQAAVLLTGGDLVMRGSLSIGRLYAVQLFSRTAFSLLLAGFTRFAPLSDPEGASPPPVFILLRRVLCERRGLLRCAVLLSLMNMACEGALLTLQRLSLRDCIPSGDWDGLVRNCLLLCAAALVSLPVRKGGAMSLGQLFHGCVPARIECRLDRFARCLVTALLGLYYGLRLPQFNRLLAGQACLVCLLALGLCLLSAGARGGRAQSVLTERLCDMVFKRLQNFLTVYIYFALTLGVTELGAGDLVLFMTALRGLCCGARDWSKIALWAAEEPVPTRAPEKTRDKPGRAESEGD